jgi:hypothetical protein
MMMPEFADRLEKQFEQLHSVVFDLGPISCYRSPTNITTRLPDAGNPGQEWTELRQVSPAFSDCNVVADKKPRFDCLLTHRAFRSVDWIAATSSQATNERIFHDLLTNP